MTKTVESHILTFSNLLSIAVNGAHVKMADLRRWASLINHHDHSVPVCQAIIGPYAISHAIAKLQASSFT